MSTKIQMAGWADQQSYVNGLANSNDIIDANE
jgi:hypothetical protein